MKPDERELLFRVDAECAPGVRTPFDVIEELVASGRINRKRAFAILAKWSDKKLYDYGVSLGFGWLTAAGKDHAAKTRGGA